MSNNTTGMSENNIVLVDERTRSADSVHSVGDFSQLLEGCREKAPSVPLKYWQNEDKAVLERETNILKKDWGLTKCCTQFPAVPYFKMCTYSRPINRKIITNLLKEDFIEYQFVFN